MTTSKYRIVPHRNFAGSFAIQRKFLFLWDTVQVGGKGVWDDITEAEAAVKQLVYLDKLNKDLELRRTSWRKAVPNVYYDENGKRIENSA